MRIVQLNCDWTENFTGVEVIEAIETVGGKRLAYDYEQDVVDSKVMFVSSHPLTQRQLDLLWLVGDLWIVDIIKGTTFKAALCMLSVETKRSELLDVATDHFSGRDLKEFINRVKKAKGPAILREYEKRFNQPEPEDGEEP